MPRMGEMYLPELSNCFTHEQTTAGIMYTRLAQDQATQNPKIDGDTDRRYFMKYYPYLWRYW